MKIVNESIFASSVRAFFVGLFSVLGVVVALVAAVMAIGAIASVADGESYSSNVKLLPDAEGRRKDLGASAPVLLQVNIDGVIGKDHLEAGKIEEMLLSSREEKLKDGRVKGILLSINSPGGGSNASFQIYQLVKRYKERYDVPVYAHIDGMCASGGYYIACAADRIMATEVSLIGSVGVLSWPPYFNISDALKKVGVETLTLSAGKGKDQLNPLRPWKEGEQAHTQEIIDFYYTQFVNTVTAMRPQLDRGKLLNEYGAEVFPAPQAVAMGFVDEANADRSEALTALALAAGIEEDEKYQVITFESKNWWRKALRNESPLFTGRVKHELHAPSLKPFYVQ